MSILERVKFLLIGALGGLITVAVLSAILYGCQMACEMPR